LIGQISGGSQTVGALVKGKAVEKVLSLVDRDDVVGPRGVGPGPVWVPGTTTRSSRSHAPRHDPSQHQDGHGGQQFLALRRQEKGGGGEVTRRRRRRRRILGRRVVVAAVDAGRGGEKGRVFLRGHGEDEDDSQCVRECWLLVEQSMMNLCTDRRRRVHVVYISEKAIAVSARCDA
jgi:hypothetical protein